MLINRLLRLDGCVCLANVSFSDRARHVEQGGNSLLSGTAISFHLSVLEDASFISPTPLQPQARMIPPQKTAELVNFAFEIPSSKCSHSFKGLWINGGEVSTSRRCGFR